MAAKKTGKPAPPQRTSNTHVSNISPDSTRFFNPGFFQENWMQVLGLIALAFALYGITLGFGYIQDDQVFIWDNDFVQKGFAGLRDIFSGDSLLGYYKDTKNLYEGGRYRPLPLASFAIEIGLFGKNHPGIGHAVNVLLYAFTGVLLYRILLALLHRNTGKKSEAWYRSFPLWVTVLFLVHPLHSEVVANIKGRDEILALLCALGTLYASMRYSDTNEVRWLAYSGLTFFLGLLSKENAATFIAVIPLTFWMFSKIPFGRIAKISLVLLGVTALYLFIRYKALGYMVRPANPVEELVLNPFMGMNPGEKFATIFLSLGWYLKLLVFPHPLTIDYYPYHVPKVTWSDWRPILSLGLYLLAGVWAARQLLSKRSTDDGVPTNKKIAAYSILFYLLTLSVVSNLFVPTSTFMNERYVYMPSLGFCLLAAWFCVKVLPEWLEKRGAKWAIAGIGLAFILAGLFAWRVFVRVPDWGGDGAKLVEKAAQVSKNSYRANYYYAAMLFKERYQKPQVGMDAAARLALLEEINGYINRSLEINPGYRLAGTMKVEVAAAKFRENRQSFSLLTDLEDIILKQPYNGDMLVQLLAVLRALKGVDPDPDIYNRFCFRIGYDFYYKQKGDMNGGIEFLKLALDNHPQDPVAMQGLMEIYTVMGDQIKAADMHQRLQALQQGR